MSKRWKIAGTLVTGTFAVLTIGCSKHEPMEKTQSPPVVAVAQGKLSGLVNDQRASVFLSIPFAKPPLGDLRWKPPVDPASWDGVRDATKISPACMQEDWGWNSADAKAGSEDCLYLNIVTPSLTPDHPLPVVFWIHGGANYNGSGRRVEGQTLTDHGVVLVAVNYRLGVFGFLAHPELTAESSHHSSGNYALMDQMQALKWVKQNISAFGGDPGNITIGGQSAGAMDVGALLVSPVAKGMFQRAVSESGGPIGPSPLLPTLKEAEATGVLFGEAAGAPKGKGQLAALRALTAQQVLDAGLKYTAPDKEGVPTHPGPSTDVDGWVITEQPAASVRKGNVNKVPLLIGSNIQEFSFSRSSVIKTGDAADPVDQVVARIKQVFGSEAPEALKVYGLSGKNEPSADPALGTVGTQLMTDSYFRCPAIMTSEWLSSKGDTVYLYQFEHPLPGTGSPSTRHSGELPYVFGWAQKAGKGLLGATYGEADAKLSHQMQLYWTNFAKLGDPNGDALPTWPKADKVPPSLMRFTSEGAAGGSTAGRTICTVLAKHVAAIAP